MKLGTLAVFSKAGRPQTGKQLFTVLLNGRWGSAEGHAGLLIWSEKDNSEAAIMPAWQPIIHTKKKCTHFDDDSRCFQRHIDCLVHRNCGIVVFDNFVSNTPKRNQHTQTHTHKHTHTHARTTIQPHKYVLTNANNSFNIHPLPTRKQTIQCLLLPTRNLLKFS